MRSRRHRDGTHEHALTKASTPERPPLFTPPLSLVERRPKNRHGVERTRFAAPREQGGGGGLVRSIVFVFDEGGGKSERFCKGCGGVLVGGGGHRKKYYRFENLLETKARA